MKRFISLLLIMLLMLSFVACGKETPADDTDADVSQGENNENDDDNVSQGDAVGSVYQVTKEQWETAFEYGENGETLLEALSNHTCHYVSENGMESVYKQVPEENLYYENSLSYEREYYYAHKGDAVDVYVNDYNGCVLLPDESWEDQKLNATDNLKYDIGYFALAYDYDNVTFSETENAYIYTMNCEIKIYFENGKLVRLTLVNSRGAMSDYSELGTTKITLPAEYEVLN